MLQPISAIILAGGRATRMGGQDKGLVLLHQKPLILHVIERLSPQVDEVLINANRELAQYNAFNLPVLSDSHPDFIGPLAGVCLGLQHAQHDYLLVVPCDSPCIPDDLAQRLMTALLAKQAEIAVVTSNGETHPVFFLCKTNVLPSLLTFIDQGERKVSAWQKSLRYIEVDFSDCHHAFVNLNTMDDLDALARLSANT